jgi:hypothetical protein
VVKPVKLYPVSLDPGFVHCRAESVKKYYCLSVTYKYVPYLALCSTLWFVSIGF